MKAVLERPELRSLAHERGALYLLELRKQVGMVAAEVLYEFAVGTAPEELADEFKTELERCRPAWISGYGGATSSLVFHVVDQAENLYNEVCEERG